MSGHESGFDEPMVPAVSDAAPLAVRVENGAVRRGRVRQELARGSAGTLKHGVYARVAVREEVLDECAALYGRIPHLDPIRDGVLVEATARIAVRLRKLDDAIDAEPTQVLTSLYSRLEGQLTRNLTALGMTPAASASLGLAHIDAATRHRKEAEARMAKYAPPKRKGSR